MTHLVPRFEEVDHPYTLWSQRICIWRDPEDLMQKFFIGSLTMNPFADLMPLISSIQDKEAQSTDEFHVLIDVLQFKVEEITVKVSEDRTITVEAKHEETQDDHGFLTRHFIRIFTLPESCNIYKVHSKLSFDGVLAISAPKVDDKEDDFWFEGGHFKSTGAETGEGEGTSAEISEGQGASAESREGQGTSAERSEGQDTSAGTSEGQVTSVERNEGQVTSGEKNKGKGTGKRSKGKGSRAHKSKGKEI